MIPIIYEDDQLFIINKPSGITVNKADTTRGEMTVQDWVTNNYEFANQQPSARFKKFEELNIPNEDFIKRAGIVHRLDKETSGILLIAKTPVSFTNLQQQFKERLIKKTYLALAHGKVTQSDGEINVPVGRLPWNRRQFGVVAGGREAVTKYKVLSVKYLDDGNKKEELTFLELYPETGRTHQIRVHLKYIGHPIFADFLYSGRKVQRSDRSRLSRVFLHASKISFSHPTTNKVMNIECPLTDDLQQFMEKLT